MLFSILNAVFFLVIPFISGSSSIEKFGFPKTFALYLYALIAGLLLLWKITFNRRKLKKTPWEISLYFFTFIISAIFSSNIYTSFWGYYSRFFDGFVSVLACIIIFKAMREFMYEHQYKITNRIVVLTCALLGIYSLLQYTLIYTSGFIWKMEIQRAFATLGQPNWLAQYLVMGMLLALYNYLCSKSFSFLDFIGLVCGFFGLWLSFSLSGLISFGAGILLTIVLIRKELSKVVLYRLSLISLFSVLFAIWKPGIFKSKVSDVAIDLEKIELAKSNDLNTNSRNSLNQLQNSISDPGFIRLLVWKGTLNIIFSSNKIFLVGAGPEVFPFVFQNFRPAELNYSSEWDFIINKAHNYYLETFAEQGLLGLISLIILYTLTYKKSPDENKPALLAFFVNIFFGWPVVASAMIFWLFVSQANSPIIEKTQNSESQQATRSSLLKFVLQIHKSLTFRFIVFFVGITLLVYTATNIYKMYSADVYAYKSKKYYEASSYTNAYEFASKAIDLNPMEPSYYRLRALSYIWNYKLQRPDFSKPTFALKDMYSAERLNPENLATYRNLFYPYFLIADTDKAYINFARNHYQKKYKYPSDVGVFAQAALFEKMLKLEKDHSESLNKINALREEVLDIKPEIN